MEILVNVDWYEVLTNFLYFLAAILAVVALITGAHLYFERMVLNIEKLVVLEKLGKVTDGEVADGIIHNDFPRDMWER